MNANVRIVGIVSRVAALSVILIAAGIWSAPPVTAQTPTLPVVAFSPSEYSVPEPEPGSANSTHDVTLTLTPTSDAAVTVQLTVEEVSTDGAADFILANQTVRFAPRVTSVNIPVTIVGNDNPEKTEEFRMRLSNPHGARISNPVGRFSITDTDIGSARLEIDTTIEGEIMYAHLVISPAYEYELTLGLETIEAYDAGDDDIDLYYVTLIIPEGTTRKTLDITTRQNNRREGFESVRIMLFGLNQNINIAQDTYRAWIADDDLPDGAHFSSDIDNLKSSLRRKSLPVYESGNPETTAVFWITRRPTENVAVTPWSNGGDEDLTITPASHVFTPDRWDPAFFTVTADDDSDAISGTRTLQFLIESEDPFYDGYDVRHTAVVEVDDDDDTDGHIIHSETHGEVVNGITASMFYAPQRRDDNDFWVFLQFSEPITGGYRTFWHQSLEHWGGQLTALHRVDGRSDLWAIEFNPQGDGDIAHLQVPGNRPCSEKGAICARGGKRLANTLTYSVAPPGVDAKLPPGIGPVPMLSAADQTVAEDAGTLQFALTLNKPATRDSSVRVITWNTTNAGEARSSSDYGFTSGPFTIAEGADSLTVDIPIIDDDVAEGDEVFQILLYDADGVELEGVPNWNQQLNSTVTIIDDD